MIMSNLAYTETYTVSDLIDQSGKFTFLGALAQKSMADLPEAKLV
jgi:hypothetical protein